MTPKQKQFCREYMVDLIGSRAAMRAGYSSKSANRAASNLLSKIDIQTEIQTLREAQEKRTEVNADWVLNQLRELALTACDSVKVSALDKIAKHLRMYDTPAAVHSESQPQIVLYWPENGRD
ncbi:terminase small subunit [Mariniblastus sp.]|nr:terminase small subunit [Mariniblastus sp.]